MASEFGYMGNPRPNKTDAIIVEIIAVILSITLFSFQVGCWIAMALIGYRLLNIGKDMI
jgi:hypothetical protein